MCYLTFRICLRKAKVENRKVGECSREKDGFLIPEFGKHKLGRWNSKRGRTTESAKESWIFNSRSREVGSQKAEGQLQFLRKVGFPIAKVRKRKLGSWKSKIGRIVETSKESWIYDSRSQKAEVGNLEVKKWKDSWEFWGKLDFWILKSEGGVKNPYAKLDHQYFISIS